MQQMSPHKNKAAELVMILARWENRYELRLLSRTVPRSLIIAAIVSLVVGLAGYFYFHLRAEQLALIAAALFAGGFILNLVKTALFPRSPQERARFFDIEFGMQERLSTALELMVGRLKTHPEIESRQIADALVHARQVNAREAIALDFRPRELALMCLLILALCLVIALPLLTGQYPVAAAPASAFEEPIETVREIIETVAQDTDLDAIDRRELLNALELALERLEEENISEEEAFAAMSQLSSEIEAIENQLEDTIDLDQSAQAAAAEALEDFAAPSDLEAAENDQGLPSSALDDLSNALEQLAQQAEQSEEMSAEEAQALAEAFEEAAAELAGTNPELSQRLQELSDALDEGASNDQHDAIEDARQELSQAQSQQESRQNAQNMLREQSERAQEAAEDIASQQSQEQGELSEQRQGQPESSESGERRRGQESSQQSDSAEQGDNQGQQQSTQNRPGTGEDASLSRDSQSSGTGAGEGDPSNISNAGAGGEDQGADTNNRSRGTGEIQYEALYSPSGISGGGTEEMRLRSDAGDQTLREGDFDDNPLGESRVSYDTVFSEYQDSANRALESDYVPLGLRDVVRDYFTSLEPTGAS